MKNSTVFTYSVMNFELLLPWKNENLELSQSVLCACNSSQIQKLNVGLLV